VQFIPMGDRWAYHCMVEYPVGSGIVVPGTDFIDLRDAAGIAKAETSAIGRALGLHGIANEFGIASAEEMERVETSSQPRQQPAKATPAQVAVKSAESSLETTLGYKLLRDAQTMNELAEMGHSNVDDVTEFIQREFPDGMPERETLRAHLKYLRAASVGIQSAPNRKAASLRTSDTIPTGARAS
jgi:hypothetical protein